MEESEKEGKEYKAEKEERKVKGRRMEIEDVSDSEETDIVEENAVNGWQKPATAVETNMAVKGNRGSVNENNVMGHVRPTEQPSHGSAVGKATKDIWQSDEVTEETVSDEPTNRTSDTSTSKHTLGDEQSTSSSKNSEARSGSPVDSQAVAAASGPSPIHTRPVLYQYPMSSGCARLREEGNTLFRTGQYAEASEKYEQAIKKFGKGNIL